MSAEIVQFIPRPNPKREEKLQQMAAEIFNAALPADYLKELTQAGAYHAPDKDSA